MRLKNFVLCLFIAFHQFLAAQPVLLSPEKFLGYPLGARYTTHHRIVEYVRHVSDASPGKVKLMNYGTTNEGRPLMLAFVSSAENIRNLDQIRINNLRLAGLSKDKAAPSEDLPVIVWLSYNVHGNEPSSSEAAMKTIHKLLDGSDMRTKEWLDKAVIVIDPCLNPDGRDRYANWQNSVTGLVPNPNVQTREHREPWPGGRTNHYHFDLNRDWAWQTQVESQQRMKVYNEWMPQVHVDFHEQGANEPYYFAPAAEPYHDVITPWQREFQQHVGKNNAASFDRQGWLYFTKERFDLLYPSYGDTYPTYNGSIGMTFEQGGGSRAGKAVVIEDGDTLTLADRLEHHYTTGLSTIEVSVRHAVRLKQEFRKFFSASQSEPAAGSNRYYVVRASTAAGPEGGVIIRYLRNNGIDHGYAQTKISARGFSYITGKEEAITIEPNDVVIPVQQPRGVMLRVLFEPRTNVTDSATYDITAWALPYAFGLQAFAVKDKLPASAIGLSVAGKTLSPPMDATDAYAFVIPWTSFGSAKLLSQLLNAGVKLRYAEQPFEIGGRRFEKGSLIVTRAANRMTIDALYAKISSAISATPDFHERIVPVRSGFVDKGFDFGSDRVRYIKAPRVAVLAGDGVGTNAFGELWHYFEQELRYPVSMINTSDIGQANWDDFDVMILADGNYRFLSDKMMTEQLNGWLRKGGRLIAMENAVLQLSKLDWTIRQKKDDGAKDDEAQDKALLKRYEDREKEYLKGSMPGAIYRMELDQSHPLAFGYPSHYFTLKQDVNIYGFMKEGGWNVGVIRSDGYVTGFAGVQAKEKLKEGLLLGVQDIGGGNIVYFAEDPIFRGFWESGKLLLANAVFMVGQ